MAAVAPTSEMSGRNYARSVGAREDSRCRTAIFRIDQPLVPLTSSPPCAPHARTRLSKVFDCRDDARLSSRSSASPRSPCVRVAPPPPRPSALPDPSLSRHRDIPCGRGARAPHGRDQGGRCLRVRRRLFRVQRLARRRPSPVFPPRPPRRQRRITPPSTPLPSAKFSSAPSAACSSRRWARTRTLAPGTTSTPSSPPSARLTT